MVIPFDFIPSLKQTILGEASPTCIFDRLSPRGIGCSLFKLSPGLQPDDVRNVFCHSVQMILNCIMKIIPKIYTLYLLPIGLGNAKKSFSLISLLSCGELIPSLLCIIMEEIFASDRKVIVWRLQRWVRCLVWNDSFRFVFDPQTFVRVGSDNKHYLFCVFRMITRLLEQPIHNRFWASSTSNIFQANSLH